MHYLITGHTGFKGSWLSLMLEMQGHTLSGISLDPAEKSLFNQANLSSIFENDIRLDIRDASKLKSTIENVDPEVIIHLAAQPLVRESYRIPVETFDINVLGTLNVLESTRNLKNLKAALIITTDKVYKNRNHLRGYVETDELGGDDPYSASKAAADIAAQSWIKSFATVPMAIARAGNVIGGGDWAQDRIIPDLVNAYSTGNLPTLRYPNAIRPWQHVLDCLNGYLTLINKQLSDGFTGEWNFGPDFSEKHSVGDLASKFATLWGVDGTCWDLKDTNQPHEAGYLLLDSSKARLTLSWKDILEFDDMVKWIFEWYALKDSSVAEATRKQIQNFLDLVTDRS
jgi:CDP-glucose 4,6-dehydratase